MTKTYSELKKQLNEAVSNPKELIKTAFQNQGIDPNDINFHRDAKDTGLSKKEQEISGTVKGSDASRLDIVKAGYEEAIEELRNQGHDVNVKASTIHTDPGKNNIIFTITFQ